MEKYIVHFCDEAEKDKIENYSGEIGISLGWTEMYFQQKPEIGEEIRISFPTSFLKNNKWFNALPTYPYTVFISLTSEERKPFFPNDQDLSGYVKVYYSGTEKVNLREIKNKRYK